MSTKIQETKAQGSKKIRKGDKVIVTTGNYGGQVGTVLKRVGDKVIIQGINMRKKHIKRSQQNPKGSIITIERPVHVSNVQLCVGENTPVKLKVQVDKKGNRSLYYFEGEREVIYRPIKKSSAS